MAENETTKFKTIQFIPKDSRDKTKTYLSELQNEIPIAKDFQICGGFEIPNVDLKSLKTDNILKRLCQIARENVVAVSEMGNGKSEDYKTKYREVNIKPDNETFNLGQHIPCLDDTNGINDTCFVIRSNDEFECENNPNNPNNPSIIFSKNDNKCGILSIHFASNGPNLLTEETKERVGKETFTNEKAISEFVKEQLTEEKVKSKKYKLNDDNKKKIRVVCGDTNITISKCSKVKFKNIKDFDNKTLDVDEKKLDTIGQQIAKGFNDYFGGYWIVIMSNYKIDKIRKGFLLINQQINKSDIDANKKPEEDGTIIAIKLSDDTNYNFTDKSEAIKELSKYCENLNYRWHTVNNSYHVVKDNSTGEIMKFSSKEEMFRDNMYYKDPVFLDHSVVQIRFSLLNKLLELKNAKGMFSFGSNTTPKPFADEFTLISLNMGSIVNSGRANWNTKHIEKYEAIKNADKALYDLVKGRNPELEPLKSQEYADFVGKGLIGKTIKYDPSFNEEIKIIGSFEEKKTSGGYKNKTKKNKNKNRNRNRKSKSKNTTKKNKNKNRNRNRKSKSKNTTKKNKNTKKHKNNKKK